MTLILLSDLCLMLKVNFVKINCDLIFHHEQCSQKLNVFVSFQVRTRGLPDDHVGQVRVVEIEGLFGGGGGGGDISIL